MEVFSIHSCMGRYFRIGESLTVVWKTDGNVDEGEKLNYCSVRLNLGRDCAPGGWLVKKRG